MTPLDEPSLPESHHRCPTELREQYRTGRLFGSWLKKYNGKWPFHDSHRSLLESNQIPHGDIRPKRALFFHELFVATQYLDAGYEVLIFWRATSETKIKAVHQVAKDLIGSSYDKILKSGRGGEPDLLVFHLATSAFRLVECKGDRESFTQNQVERFPQINALLAKYPPPCRTPLGNDGNATLFPQLPDGDWIHVARVEPDGSS